MRVPPPTNAFTAPAANAAPAAPKIEDAEIQFRTRVRRSLTERNSTVALNRPEKWRYRRCADPKRQRESRP
jgi:hypothetical protein